MKKTKVQLFGNFGIAMLLVAFAVACRYIIMTAEGLSPFADKLLNYIRIFIYIGMLSVWGVSVSRRVIQKSVRRMLIVISAVMVLWLVVREFRFRYVISPEAIRLLWYAYYIPLLVIPLLALFIAVCAGKGDDYILPKPIWAFCIPTGALLALVLTNDIHQFAFHLNSSAPRSDVDYGYGWLYYAITVWVYFCSLLAFAIMLKKFRLPKSRRNKWMPLLPVAFAIIYGVLYAARAPFIINYVGDITVVFCLVFAGFFEICIESGLIQSNSGYSYLFTSSKNIPVQILDNSLNVRYAASASEKIEVENIKKALKSPVILNDGKRLHAMPVRGGYAVWTEDISELLNVREILTERGEELSERAEFLKLEYKKEEEHRTVAEQNRLYDLLQRKTQSQLDILDSYVQKYRFAESEGEKQRLLAQIVILGTFIKRRKNFVLTMENAASFPEALLQSAIAESFSALSQLNIRGSYFVYTGREEISGEILSLAYDFFEDVIEAVFDSARYINFRFCEVNGKIRISILTDFEGDFSPLLLKYPSLVTVFDDGTQFILEPKGGDNNE